MNYNLKKTKRTLAFILLPLLFVVFGYFIIYITFFDTAYMYFSGFDMVISPYTPDFSEEITSIFIDIEPEQSNTAIQKYVNQAEIVMPTYGTHYAKLSFDSVGTELDLYFGDSDKILKLGAGQYIGSSIPGYNKPILIAGHNNNHFYTSKDIKLSDTITITTNYGVFIYKVNDIKVITDEDTEAFDLSTNKEQLILYTCYPFDTVGFSKQRYFIYAEKLSGPEIIKNTKKLS